MTTAWFLIVLLLGLPQGVMADAAGTPASATQPRENIDDLDPLAVDEHDELDVTREQVNPAPQPQLRVPPPIVRGETIDGISGVREESYRASVRLTAGLALVTVQSVLRDRGRDPSTVAVRVRLPAGAVLVALSACDGATCSAGEHTPAAGRVVIRRGDGNAPWVRADRHGDVLEVSAGPVRGLATLTLEATYVAEAPAVGGVVRFVMPGRATDGRIAPTRVLLDAGELGDATVDGSPPAFDGLLLDGWRDVAITARVTRGAQLHAWRATCAAGPCARAWAASPPQSAQVAGDVALVLDVSPSMAGPRRGRMTNVVASLLGAIPERVRLRAVALGARAVQVVPEWTSAREVPLATLLAHEAPELGAATRYEAAWSALSPWARTAQGGMHVVIVGDGGLTRGTEGSRALAAMRRAGMRVDYVNVAERPLDEELTRLVAAGGGVVIDAVRAASVGGDGTEPLAERLAVLFATKTSVRGPNGFAAEAERDARLWHGEQLAWEGPLATSGVRLGSAAVRFEAPDPVLASAISARIDARFAAREDRMDVEAAVDVARAHTLARCQRSARACPASEQPRRDPGVAPAAPQSLPSEPLLVQLRQRIMPVARGCFRADRAGRPAYATRAEFVFMLSDSEVSDADVRGRITPELRTCLSQAFDGLDVPRFEGAVIVRYPLVTEAIPPPPTIELTPDVARRLDAWLGD